jgi:hypothetical protein
MLTLRHLAAYLFIALASVPVSAGVSVRTATPEVQYKTFDPDHPPADMPHLTPPETAVTVSRFDFHATPDWDVVSRTRGSDGNWTAVIVVNGVSIYPKLKIVVWTPKGVSKKLKAHEDGHRKLNELIFRQRAAEAARAAGAVMDGHQATGEGSTGAKAAASALQAIFQQAGDRYVAGTQAVSVEVNDIYDELTLHGTNDVPEEQAMTQALEIYNKKHAATQPAEKK